MPAFIVNMIVTIIVNYFVTPETLKKAMIALLKTLQTALKAGGYDDVAQIVGTLVAWLESAVAEPIIAQMAGDLEADPEFASSISDAVRGMK